MAFIFLGLAALGLCGVLCNIAGAVGEVLCAVLKYAVLPFGLLLSICYIAEYGL